MGTLAFRVSCLYHRRADRRRARAYAAYYRAYGDAMMRGRGLL